MILIPQRYSPGTLIKRLEDSPIFGVTFDTYTQEVSGGEEQRKKFSIQGPHRESADKTQGTGSYNGTLLRTRIELIALEAAEQEVSVTTRRPLSQSEIVDKMTALLGKPSRWKDEDFWFTARYDFSQKGYIPNIYDVAVMTEGQAKLYLQNISEGKRVIDREGVVKVEYGVIWGKLPAGINKRVLRKDKK
ncbi:MAG TPA: hypothetical protein VJJ21_04730 [Candidatus Nanoarchaeia archaeon]|nr:hypothetical protein [Candidatus Nanoarchaeia archaeon]